MNINEKIKENTLITVGEKSYRVIGKAFYVTQNDPDTPYIKVLLENHNVLVIMPSEQMAYIGYNAGAITEFDEYPESITFKGKQFKKINHDYQIVTNIEFGSPLDVEGEVEFWDYECGQSIISVAIVSRNKQRADVVAEYISIHDINL